MVQSTSRIAELLTQAKQGHDEALGQLLEAFRNWLRIFASQQLPDETRPRIDPSDLIQDTLKSAIKNFADFRGETPIEFQIWLKRIHERNLQDTIKFHRGAQKRNVRRTIGMNPNVDLPKAGDEPIEDVILGEEAIALADALEKLPETQQEAIRLRFTDHLSVAEIGKRLNRSRDAAAGLIKRGLRNLRQHMERASEDA